MPRLPRTSQPPSPSNTTYITLEELMEDGLDEDVVIEIVDEDMVSSDDSSEDSYDEEEYPWDSEEEESEFEIVQDVLSLEDTLAREEDQIDLLMGAMVNLRQHGLPETVINVMANRIQMKERLCRDYEQSLDVGSN